MKKKEPKAIAMLISSEKLRSRVEADLGRKVNDDVWQRSEKYARRKLDHCSLKQPELYSSEYLVLLTSDTVRETEFSDFTMADVERKMAAERRAENG